MSHLHRLPRARAGVAALLALLLVAGAACSDEQTASLESAAQKASAAASRLSGPARAASDSLTDSLSSARGALPAAARGLADNARCVGDGTVSVLGDELVGRYRAAGADLADTSALTTAKARELRESLDSCVEVQPMLVGALTGAGLSNDKATCVAERALRDDKALAGIMLNMVFGDPGFLTVVAIAVRAGQGCLSPADLQRLLPNG